MAGAGPKREGVKTTAAPALDSTGSYLVGRATSFLSSFGRKGEEGKGAGASGKPKIKADPFAGLSPAEKAERKF